MDKVILFSVSVAENGFVLTVNGEDFNGGSTEFKNEQFVARRVEDLKELLNEHVFTVLEE